MEVWQDKVKGTWSYKFEHEGIAYSEEGFQSNLDCRSTGGIKYIQVVTGEGFTPESRESKEKPLFKDANNRLPGKSNPNPSIEKESKEQTELIPRQDENKTEKVPPKNEPETNNSKHFAEDSNSESTIQSNEESTIQTEDDLIPKQNDAQIEGEGHTGERIGEGTKFTIDRKIFSSDIWFDSPWKVKIWFYLIGNANHTDGHFMGIPIKRGQLIRSYRTIAKDCGYYIGYRFKKPSINTVRRICEDLTKDSRIVRRTVQPGTLFSICNYNSLQPFPKQRTVQRKVERQYSSSTTPVHNKNVKKKKPYSLTSIEVRLSELLLRLILGRRNTFKGPKNIQDWAEHIGFMLRVDKRDSEEIEGVIRWCQADEFWGNNILSTVKLREQFDQLALKMGEGTRDGKQKERPEWA